MPTAYVGPGWENPERTTIFGGSVADVYKRDGFVIAALVEVSHLDRASRRAEGDILIFGPKSRTTSLATARDFEEAETAMAKLKAAGHPQILGWPTPENCGGHRVQRSSDDLDRPGEYTCIDCEKRGSVTLFTVGVDGCPGRAESLNYLHIDAFVGFDRMSDAERIEAAREHWRSFARGVGLVVNNWVPVEDDATVCASFTFKDAAYTLTCDEYGKIAARKIEG